MLSVTRLFTYLFFLSSLASCSSSGKPQARKVNLSFYHWKANYDPAKPEKKMLETLKVNKLYLRYFDVDWPGEEPEPHPLSLITFDQKPPDSLEIIPVVFITNRCMQRVSPEKAGNLAEKIWALLRKLHPRPEAPYEIQLDCDWSDRSREAFFALLEALRLKDVQLGATIRLHQVKYAAVTGIPPVDKGTLMFYNMGNLQDIKTANSILSFEEARPYLSELSNYPLPLDLALPLFSWGALFRDGRMIKLINQLERKELEADSLAYSRNGIWYRVNRPGLLRGHFLYAGDTVRMENSPAEELERSVNFLSSHLNHEEIELIYFHLDSSALKPYPYEFLQELGDKMAQSRH